MMPTAAPGSLLGPGKPTITGFRPVNRGALIGEFKMMFWATVILTLDYFKTDASRWVNFPARTFAKRTGGLGRVPLFEFANPEIQKEYQDAALAAIDAFYSQIGDTTPAAAAPNAEHSLPVTGGAASQPAAAPDPEESSKADADSAPA
jgi:hypothetical protein